MLRQVVWENLHPTTKTGFTPELLQLLTNSTLEAKLVFLPSDLTMVESKDGELDHHITDKLEEKLSDTASSN